MDYKKELDELTEWLKNALSFKLPSYKELPPVPLYMEQVVTYINTIMAPLSSGEKKNLTSFMVNNYVKAKIIDDPVKKKYDSNQLGYLLAIYSLKEVLNMSDISLLIEMDEDVSTDKSTLYRFYSRMSEDIISTRVGQAKDKVEMYKQSYERQKKADNPKAEQYLNDELALMALRLSIKSSIDKILAEALLATIAKTTNKKELASTKTLHESKFVEKAALEESKRVAEAKAKISRKKKKEMESLEMSSKPQKQKKEKKK